MTEAEVAASIGLGCARLDGGWSERSSINLVHAAIDLGVRHFDVAPSYGLGLAELVLGKALISKQASEPKITTKLGIAAPRRPRLMSAVKQISAPLARRISPLRSAGLRSLNSRFEHGVFEPSIVRGVVEKSLKNLKVEAVHGLLLHEPSSQSDVRLVQKLLDELRSSGKVGHLGTATRNPPRLVVPFGELFQARWPSPSDSLNANAAWTLHGVIRTLSPVLQDRASEVRKAWRPLEEHPYLRAVDRFAVLSLCFALRKWQARLLISTREIKKLENLVVGASLVLKSSAWDSLYTELDRGYLLTDR